MEEDNAFEEAAKTGKATASFMVPHDKDSKIKKQRYCRWWPEVHEMDKEGYFKQMVMVSPTKLDSTLLRKNYFQYEAEVDLEESVIVGPFNFAPSTAGNKSQKANYVVASEDWEALEAKAKYFDVSVENVDQIIPLGHVS